MDKTCACVDFNCDEATDGKAVPFCGTAFVPQLIPDLSYEEQYAGFHNVDGRRVYTRLVDLGNLANSPNGRVDLEVDSGISNLLEVIDLRVRRKNPFNNSVIFGNLCDLGFAQNFVMKDNKILAITINSDCSEHTAVAQIYYTCTDR
ncbi:MAG: hypothetical protein LUH04_03775 [Clostridium sp.]|nr:hypothetical protein [Clostridium sp.]